MVIYPLPTCNHRCLFKGPSKAYTPSKKVTMLLSALGALAGRSGGAEGSDDELVGGRGGSSLEGKKRRRSESGSGESGGGGGGGAGSWHSPPVTSAEALRHRLRSHGAALVVSALRLWIREPAEGAGGDGGGKDALLKRALADI